jgi:hypothetical protein
MSHAGSDLSRQRLAIHVFDEEGGTVFAFDGPQPEVVARGGPRTRIDDESHGGHTIVCPPSTTKEDPTT